MLAIALAVTYADASFQIVTWGQSKTTGNMMIGSNWIINSGYTCVQSWECSAYSSCNITDGMSCLSITDLNYCGESFTGDMTIYDDECSFCEENADIDVCEAKKMYEIALILLPVIFGLFAIIGAVTLSQQHSAFKIGMFILGLASVLGSLYLGGVIVGTGHEEIQIALSRTTYWIGIMFAVVIFYFLIYATYVMFKKAAQEKEERLDY